MSTLHSSYSVDCFCSPDKSCICQPLFHCSRSFISVALLPILFPPWLCLSTTCASYNAPFICHLFWEPLLKSSIFSTPIVLCLYFPVGTHGSLIGTCLFLSLKNSSLSTGGMFFFVSKSLLQAMSTVHTHNPWVINLNCN